MKILKKATIIVFFSISIMLLAVVLLLQTGNTASAINKNKESLPEVEYIINGETVTGDVTVERGTYISVIINYGGEKYIPELYTDTENFAYDIIGNELSISSNSRIGGELLLYAVIIKDGIEITLEPITIVPVWESNFGEKIVNLSCLWLRVIVAIHPNNPKKWSVCKWEIKTLLIFIKEVLESINCLCVPSGASNNKLFPPCEMITEAKALSFWGTLPEVPRNWIFIFSIILIGNSLFLYPSKSI